MKVDKKLVPDPNLIATSISAFVRYYNQNIPESFPHATVEILQKFQVAHPELFKEGETEWTIDKHRKRFMDWFASYQAGF